jgi:hypothetical protein
VPWFIHPDDQPDFPDASPDDFFPDDYESPEQWLEKTLEGLQEEQISIHPKAFLESFPNSFDK